MISTSTNKLKVVIRYGIQLQRINVEQVFLASHNVFHSYISLVLQNAVLCGNELKRFSDLCRICDHTAGCLFFITRSPKNRANYVPSTGHHILLSWKDLQIL